MDSHPFSPSGLCSFLIMHPCSIFLSPSLGAGPRPFCPVMWAVFWWRAGAVSFREPRPVLSVGWPGSAGRSGSGIRVWAQWLGTVVSTPRACTHTGLRRCRGLISWTQQLMLAVTSDQCRERKGGRQGQTVITCTFPALLYISITSGKYCMYIRCVLVLYWFWLCAHKSKVTSYINKINVITEEFVHVKAELKEVSGQNNETETEDEGWE